MATEGYTMCRHGITTSTSEAGFSWHHSEHKYSRQQAISQKGITAAVCEDKQRSFIVLLIRSIAYGIRYANGRWKSDRRFHLRIVASLMPYCCARAVIGAWAVGLFLYG